MKKCTSLAQRMEKAVAAGTGLTQQPSILCSKLAQLKLILFIDLQYCVF